MQLQTLQLKLKLKLNLLLKVLALLIMFACARVAAVRCSGGIRRMGSKVVGSSPGDIKAGADMIRRGALVAFPTETVYGLGADAFNESALAKVFEAKQRPRNDPLIVHVSDFAAVQLLVEFPGTARGEVAQRIYEQLAKSFWPGPLTIVYRAHRRVPTLVTANTGFVGVRSPVHKIARQLLLESNTPIAAPSANRFGHVSPTTAQHVFDDLGDCNDLMIIDGGARSCDVGVESTVCKIDDVGCSVNVLRAGAVTPSQLERALKQIGVNWSVARSKPTTSPPLVHHLNNEHHTHDEQRIEESPGRFIRHYAPDVTTSLADASTAASSLSEAGKRILSRAAVVDFGGQLKKLQPLAKHYVDLSAQGDPREAAANLFGVLRAMEAKQLAAAARKDDVSIVLVDLRHLAEEDEHVAVLYDRLNRAASGTVINLAKEEWN